MWSLPWEKLPPLVAGPLLVVLGLLFGISGASSPDSARRVGVIVFGEPLRVCRRLHSLRGWSSEQTTEVFA